jgi:hypothetical protein
MEFKEYKNYNNLVSQQNELNYLKGEVDRLMMEKTVGNQETAIYNEQKVEEEGLIERVIFKVKIRWNC